MPGHSPPSERLTRLLAETGRRVRRRRGVMSITPGAVAGGVVALGLIAAARITLIPGWCGWLAPLAVFGGAGVAFLIAWSRPVSPLEMAELLDRRYGLAERITTGWEIAARGAKTPVEERAVEAAVEAAVAARPIEAVPYRPPRATPVTAGSLVLPLLLLWLLPGWVPAGLAERRIEKEEVKQAGNELMKEALALATPSPAPTAPPKAGSTPAPATTPKRPDTADKMKELATRMQKGEVGKREAMKEMAQLEKEAAKAQSQASRDEAARSLERAASELEENETTHGLGKAMSEQEADQVRKEQAALEKKLDLKNGFEAKERQSLADELDKLSQAFQQGGDEATARELAQTADALRKGDLQSAKEHLSKADLAAATEAAEEADPVHRMARELEKNPDTHEAGKAMDQGSPRKTGESLSHLADQLEKGQLGKEGEQKLEKTLEQAAKEGASQGESTPGAQMARPLAKAGESLQAGNRSGASEALRDLSRAMHQAGSTAQRNAQARQALAQVEQRLAGGGAGTGSGDGVQKMPWTDQPGGNGSGTGDGQGQGQAGGQQTASSGGQAGTEAGRGTSKYQANGSQAPGSGPQYDRQSDRHSDWRKEYEQAYHALRTDRARTSDTRVHGQLGQGETGYTQRDGKPPEKGQAKEGYLDLPPGYRNAAAEAVDDEEIPPEERERVKAYFESLSGNGTAPAASPTP